MRQTLEWVRCKIGQKILGPVLVSELRKVPGFTLQTPVLSEGAHLWQPAFQAIDLDSYFGRKLSKTRLATPSLELNYTLNEALGKLTQARAQAARPAPAPWGMPQLKHALQRAGQIFVLAFGLGSAGLLAYTAGPYYVPIMKAYFHAIHTPVKKVSAPHRIPAPAKKPHPLHRKAVAHRHAKRNLAKHLVKSQHARLHKISPHRNA